MPLINNPIQQLASSYSKSLNSKLILIQSTAGYKQRQAAISSQSDVDIYQRAGVRTPSQNARRDMTGGAMFLLEVIKQLSKHSKRRGIWVQTTNSLSTSMLPESVNVLNVSSDPLNWDKDETENEKGRLSLESLESLACKIERVAATAETGPITVVVESLVPLILRHGFAATISWLHRLLKHQTMILVVPIDTDSFTIRQLVALQDLCHACLLLKNGEATLIRQGGRDSTNLLRQQVPFKIIQDPKSGAVSLAVEANQVECNVEKEAKTIPDAPAVPATIVPAPTTAPTALPGKMVLQHQDDESERPPTTTSAIPKRPQIYMQDNDPEFDDLDEEDPDDDLDI